MYALSKVGKCPTGEAKVHLSKLYIEPPMINIAGFTECHCAFSLILRFEGVQFEIFPIAAPVNTGMRNTTQPGTFEIAFRMNPMSILSRLKVQTRQNVGFLDSSIVLLEHSGHTSTAS